MFTPRIIITGAGPGGLALARLLHLRGMPSILLDLRSRPTPAEVALPSGMLDLHEGTGLAAISACGLDAEFRAAVGDCSEAIRVRTPSCKLLYSNEGEGSNRPEIPRASLIDILVRSLPETAIQWGSKVAAVRTKTVSSGGTEAVVELASGKELRADLVVGADGAWSKTRRLLTDVKPVYTSLQYITATARHITQNHPHLLDLIGSGASFALGGGHGLMTHRGPQDSMRLYIAIKTAEEDWAGTTGLKGKPATAVKEAVLADPGLFGGWAPELQDIVRIACDEDTRDSGGAAADIKPIYTLPRTDLWEPRAGVTILGDAAHLMAPNGEGVNSALADALDLARLIGEPVQAETAQEWQEAIAPRIRAYEEIMHRRAEESFRETEELLGIMHGENGAQAVTDMFKSFEAGPGDEAAEVVQMTK